MLYDFIIANQEEIIQRARQRLKQRCVPRIAEAKLEHGVPVFLDQLLEALSPRNLELVDDAKRADTTKRIGDSAALHGHELLEHGFTVAQVVHGYGDICQVVTELATQARDAISSDDFNIFNRCLDDAIAGAVTAYASQRERDLAYAGTERLGVLAHELRNLISTATLSFDVMKRGMVGLAGSTGAIHSRSLAALRTLVERSLAEVRLHAGLPSFERVSVAEFVEELEVSATLHAEGMGLHLRVTSVDSEVWMEVDRQLLTSAVMNLLQNAFKFTHPHSTVTFAAHASAERVRFEVSDECGGLPPDTIERLFQPFARGEVSRVGLGLGLSIALSAARANLGELYARDAPGVGCVFTVDLPRALPPTGLHLLPRKDRNASIGGGATGANATQAARARRE